MNTIKNDAVNEIIINKSKFITSIVKVKDIIDCKNKLLEIKNTYKDATHNCFAYKIDNIKRFNDDKEPAGTAGMPILNVIDNNDLNHVLIVVSRYFGGIKLGAGGLLRAYSSSCSECLKLCEIIEEKKYIKMKIEFDYNNLKNIDYILRDYEVTYKEYDDIITYEFLYEENNYPDEIDNYIISKEAD